MFNTEDVYTVVGTELLRRRGCEFTVELKNAVMGLTAQASFELMIARYDLEDSWEALQRESNRLFVRALPGRLAPMPGLFTLLDALETRQIPKAIATGSDRELVDACLSPFNLRSRFQFVLTSEDVVRGKPDPEIYRKARRKWGSGLNGTVVSKLL